MVCLRGTHWRRLECARKSAQTRSDDHHPAANSNQVRNKKRAEISKIPARSVISGSLSKPPPSASRPPHRARKLSIRRTLTCADRIVPKIVPEIVPARSQNRLGTTAMTPSDRSSEGNGSFRRSSVPQVVGASQHPRTSWRPLLGSVCGCDDERVTRIAMLTPQKHAAV